MLIPLAPSPLPPGLAVLVLGVVLIVFRRPVVDVVPAQHLPAEVDEDLIHIHCETSAGYENTAFLVGYTLRVRALLS
jgi:hypothetical protein